MSRPLLHTTRTVINYFHFPLRIQVFRKAVHSISLGCFTLGKWWYYARSKRRDSIAPIPENLKPQKHRWKNLNSCTIFAHCHTAWQPHIFHTLQVRAVCESQHLHLYILHRLLTRNLDALFTTRTRIPTPGPPCTKLYLPASPSVNNILWVTKVCLWNVLFNALIVCSITQYSTWSFLSTDLLVPYRRRKKTVAARYCATWIMLASHSTRITGPSLIRGHMRAL
jgi:hypothetical protein